MSARPAAREAPARPFLRGLLLRRSAWIEARVLDSARRHGYAAVTPAMSRMFGCMRARPIGLSEIARLLGTSRQAVHQLATEAARLGLVELLASEDDARVKLLRFTPRGREMSERAARDFAAMEDALAERIGRRDLEALRRILAKAWPGDEPRGGGPGRLA